MTTPILGIEEIAGNQQNQYVTANEAFRKLEGASNDIFAIDLSAGDAVITAEQFTAAYAFLASGHSVARVLTVPASKRAFVVINEGTANIAVTCGSSSVVVPGDASALLFTDGTANGIYGISGHGALGTMAMQNANAVAITGGNIDNTVIGGATRAAANVTDFDASGTFQLSASAPKILAQMTGATNADDLTFQSSTLNGRTIFNVAPNGTGTVAGFNVFNRSDVMNAAYFGLSAQLADFRFSSGVLGTGTAMPLSIRMGAFRAVDISVTGEVGFNVLSPTTEAKIQSSNGIKLGNSANPNANVLDWYEEGNINAPAIVGTTTPGTGTYTARSGQYTREGNKYDFTINLGWSAHTGTGNMRVSGLPFTSSSLAAFSIQFNGLVVGAGKQLNPRLVSAASTQIALFVDDLAGGASLELPIDSAVASMTITGTCFV